MDAVCNLHELDILLFFHGRTYCVLWRTAAVIHHKLPLPTHLMFMLIGAVNHQGWSRITVQCRVGWKVFTNFTIQLKIINCQEKYDSNFIDGCIHSFCVHSL
jgi:hypothetical protein